MKLKRYLKRWKITQTEFAEAAGLERQQVWQYVHSLQIPRIEAMRAIQKATGGAVGPGDFYDGK